MNKTIPIILLLAIPLISLHAGDEVPLDRNELSFVKKKLQSVLTALGTPPEGYLKNDEKFNIPTKIYTGSGGFNPAHSSGRFKFGGESSEKIAMEYQKKMMEAQSRGDAAAMSKLSAEIQSKAMNSAISEIEIEIETNISDTITADPDNILLEKPGVIAIITESNDMKISVTLFFDPSSLKNTANQSEIEINHPDVIKSKTGVANFAVKMEGPADAVKNWIKKIQIQNVFAQIDVK